MECKIEIQNTLQQMGGLNREAMEQQQQQQQQQEQQQFNRGKRKQAVNPSQGGIHPLIYIFGFLILAGIAFTVAVINASSKQGVANRKKISKKKLEKQKIKEQQRR
jgi:hypothetical protein